VHDTRQTFIQKWIYCKQTSHAITSIDVLNIYIVSTNRELDKVADYQGIISEKLLKILIE